MTDKTEMPEDKQKALAAMNNAEKLLSDEKLNLTHCKLLLCIHGKTIRASLQTPSVPVAVADALAEALELPSRMVDADMMFGLSDFDHLPYETVQKIARATLRIVGQRNTEALAAYNKIKQGGV